jgi:hypothetical protein
MALIKILLRRGTATEWTNANPVLDAGEPGFETITGKLKIGDGTTAWNSLDYVANDFEITDLGDVIITDPEAGQILAFNGTNWVNSTQDTAGATYTIATEGTSGSVDVVLAGSDDTTDGVTFTAGSGITITNANDTITIANSVTDTNTTYTASAETTTGGANFRLTPSTGTAQDIKIASGTNVTVERTDAGTITINASGGVTEIVEDTTPQLGGDLDLNNNDIVSGVTTLINGTTASINLDGTVKGNIVPDTDSDGTTGYDIGSASYKFKDLYLSGTTLYLGAATISATGTGEVSLPAGSTVGGIDVGTILLKGSVADETALAALVDPVVGDAYIVTDFTPKRLYVFTDPTFINLGDFQGPTGDAGADGADGIDGTNGTNGTNGTDGTDGKTVLNGTTDPTTEGADGDFYINTTSSEIFGPKAAGTWPAGVSLVGPTGDAGADGADGSGVPAGGAEGQILAKASIDDGDVEWIDAPTGSGTSLGSRVIVTGTSSTLADNGSGPINIFEAFTSYALLKMQVSHAAWVRVYVSEAARQADVARTEGTDPAPGAGVIAEVITTGDQTILISPATIGFNNEDPITTTIPIRVTNKSGGAAEISVTLTILQLEA